MTEPQKKKIVEVYQEVSTSEVTFQSNEITIATTGVQGPKGETGDLGPTGPQGQIGETGPQGPPGQGATTLSFSFEQQSDSSTWSITHNLGYRPSVTVQDYGKITIEGEIEHLDINNLVVRFSVPVSGYAYLS